MLLHREGAEVWAQDYTDTTTINFLSVKYSVDSVD